MPHYGLTGALSNWGRRSGLVQEVPTARALFFVVRHYHVKRCMTLCIREPAQHQPVAFTAIYAGYFSGSEPEFPAKTANRTKKKKVVAVLLLVMGSV